MKTITFNPDEWQLVPMTAERAKYFMERFKHEEKLLGPNEQAALDFVISMLNAAPSQVVIDTCDSGHRFAKLSDHPMRDGKARCPHCLAIGLDAARSEQAAAAHEPWCASLTQLLLSHPPKPAQCNCKTAPSQEPDEVKCKLCDDTGMIPGSSAVCLCEEPLTPEELAPPITTASMQEPVMKYDESTGVAYKIGGASIEDGASLYTHPSDAAAQIAELNKQRDEAWSEFKALSERCGKTIAEKIEQIAKLEAAARKAHSELLAIRNVNREYTPRGVDEAIDQIREALKECEG